jgi:hypothetical protein
VYQTIPKRVKLPFLLAYNAADTLARDPHKNEKNVTVKSAESDFEFK